ncbi:nuclear transport factor 2 family protein [Nocardioides sp. CER19]|uniref:nuclear transport factor 2 family protein n=1 Tax=Nocardioides sp. CER19 TaxID=3038538 RepID=UPI002446FECE|nr:nuclear transport factor 2 family protein [Nocardioides sp. CER19]MDH2414451.1 nuclear transport factor 2 family protein [Nocardioides sp. CER19]
MDAAKQVRTAAEDRATALVAGDAERLMDLLHEEFTWTTHVGETVDRTEYVRRNTEGQTVWHAQAMTDVEVVVVGNTAVLRAEVTDRVTFAEGDVETFRMPMTQVWVLSAGGWKCLAGHAGPRRS